MHTVRKRLWIALGLGLMTIVAHAGVVGCGFFFLDDQGYVTENTHVRTGLSWENVAWAFTTLHACYWQPMTWLSLQTDASLFGGEGAWGFHLTNLLWHIANVVLLFVLWERMTGELWPSALVAGLFAVHPQHVESVAWVTERKDVLSMFFGLLALASYVAYVARPGLKRYALVALCLLLGLMAKPMLVTLPCVMLLLDYWPLNRLRQFASGLGVRSAWFWLVVEKLPLLALSLAFSFITYTGHRLGGGLIEEGPPLESRLGNALVACLIYLEKTLWPVNLAVLYPWTVLPAWRIVLSAAVLLGVTATALALRKTCPAILVGWLWFLGTLVPVLGLVQAGEQALADRFVYLPHIGLFVCLVWAGKAVAARLRLPISLTATLSATALVVLALLTRNQVGYWKDSRTLFEHGLEATENNHAIHRRLGELLFAQGQWQDGIRHFHSSLQIAPNQAQPHLFLGIHWANQGEQKKAEEEFRHALHLLSNVNNLGYRESYYLGIAQARLGNTEAARQSFARSLSRNPDYADAHHELGLLALSDGNWHNAQEHFAGALALEPRLADAYNGQGLAFLRMGRFAAAVSSLEMAVSLAPPAMNYAANLAHACALYGQKDKAAQVFAWIRQRSPDWPQQACARAMELTDSHAAARDPVQAAELVLQACQMTGYQDAAVLERAVEVLRRAQGDSALIESLRQKIQARRE